MSPSLDHLSLAQAGALRAARMRALLIAAAGYYFFGYWFSQRRA